MGTRESALAIKVFFEELILDNTFFIVISVCITRNILLYACEKSVKGKIRENTYQNAKEKRCTKDMYTKKKYDL